MKGYPKSFSDKLKAHMRIAGKEEADYIDRWIDIFGIEWKYSEYPSKYHPERLITIGIRLDPFNMKIYYDAGWWNHDKEGRPTDYFRMVDFYDEMEIDLGEMDLTHYLYACLWKWF